MFGMLPVHAELGQHLITPSAKTFKAVEVNVTMRKSFKIANEDACNIFVTVMLIYDKNAIKGPFGNLYVELIKDNHYLAGIPVAPADPNQYDAQSKNLKLPKGYEKTIFIFQINQNLIQETTEETRGTWCSIRYENHNLVLYLKDWETPERKP